MPIIPRKRFPKKKPEPANDFLEFDEKPRTRDSFNDDWDGSDWKPVSRLTYGISTVMFFYMVYLLASYNPITGGSLIIMMLHNVNLVFHEFGHPAFSLFGETMGILGGTLGQLGIPLVVAVAFWKKRDSLGFAVGCFWFFENFLDVAVYMADAIDLKLQLIGGLGMEAHDWRNLFLRWDCILSAKTIAGVTSALGWIGMFWAWLWLGWRCLWTRNAQLQ
jgi:hypothetical protein